MLRAHGAAAGHRPAVALFRGEAVRGLEGTQGQARGASRHGLSAEWTHSKSRSVILVRISSISHQERRIVDSIVTTFCCDEAIGSATPSKSTLSIRFISLYSGIPDRRVKRCLWLRSWLDRLKLYSTALDYNLLQMEPWPERSRLFVCSVLSFP